MACCHTSFFLLLLCLHEVDQHSTQSTTFIHNVYGPFMEAKYQENNPFYPQSLDDENPQPSGSMLEANEDLNPPYPQNQIPPDAQEVASTPDSHDESNADGNPQRTKKSVDAYIIPEDISEDETSYISRSYSDARLFPLPPPTYGYCIPENGIRRVCQPRAHCFYRYSLGVFVRPTDTCTLDGGKIGACCPTYDFGNEGIVPYDNDDYYEEALSDSRKIQDYGQLYQRGIEQYRHMQEQERTLVNRGHGIPEETPDYDHFLMQQGSPEAMEDYRNAIIRNEASQQITKELALQPPFHYHLWNTSLNATCKPLPTCYLKSYNSPDGTCNNLKNPLWGATNAVLHRLLAPAYADGVDAPRMAYDGGMLPSARLVSLAVTSTAKNPLLSVTHLTMSIGQFISHDIGRIPIVTDELRKSVNCCSPDVRSIPACFPILTPPFDPSYAPKGITCLQFSRSLPAPPENCRISYYREQMNEATAFLDGSHIYGISKKESEDLRAYKDGLLKTSLINGEAHLQFRTNTTTCGNRRLRFFCFKTGDTRSDQHPGSTLLHIVFLREHNRIAYALKALNPFWTDETIYQETRRLVIAEYQHIIFNEFLSILLDYSTRQRYQLLLQAEGYSYRYNPTIKPNLVNGFATAAYRFGHSLVQDDINLLRNDDPHAHVLMEDYFFRTELFYKKYHTEMLAEGYITDSAQAADKYYAEAIINKLFKGTNGHGLDLFAINVQRGRDHGIPGYNEWRRFCGLPYAESFDDLIDVMPYDSIEQLRRVYTSVHDIDLYPGGIMEYPRPGGLVGPTFSCIIADQFRRFKLGDRFWYERYNKHEKIGFTPEQLQEIRKATMARLLCDTTYIGLVQPLVLVKPGSYNQKVVCSDAAISSLDLTLWRQRD